MKWEKNRYLLLRHGLVIHSTNHGQLSLLFVQLGLSSLQVTHGNGQTSLLHSQVSLQTQQYHCSSLATYWFALCADTWLAAVSGCRSPMATARRASCTAKLALQTQQYHCSSLATYWFALCADTWLAAVSGCRSPMATARRASCTAKLAYRHSSITVVPWLHTDLLYVQTHD